MEFLTLVLERWESLAFLQDGEESFFAKVLQFPGKALSSPLVQSTVGVFLFILSLPIFEHASLAVPFHGFQGFLRQVFKTSERNVPTTLIEFLDLFGTFVKELEVRGHEFFRTWDVKVLLSGSNVSSFVIDAQYFLTHTIQLRPDGLGDDDDHPGLYAYDRFKIEAHTLIERGRTIISARPRGTPMSLVSNKLKELVERLELHTRSQRGAAGRMQPFAVCVFGPPRAGKTGIARQVVANLA